YHQQAGENALCKNAYQEAIDHLNKGLELLQQLPDSPEYAQQEIALLVALGPILMATKGYAAPEVEQVYARARTRGKQTGDAQQQFSILRGYLTMSIVRGALPLARGLAEELFDAARRQHDSAISTEAHNALGIVSFYEGAFAQSREYCTQSLVLYDS